MHLFAQSLVHSSICLPSRLLSRVLEPDHVEGTKFEVANSKDSSEQNEREVRSVREAARTDIDKMKERYIQ